MGAQVSKSQHEKILNYIKIGQSEGAKVLTGGEANDVVDGGFYIKPTILSGKNNMRVFQEEIFGPVTSVTTFKTDEEAIAIANDTVYGLGAGVWTRDAHQAGAPFGGYKQSGFGRETHKMMLSHYRQTKN